MLLSALVERVGRLSLRDTQREMNNALRGFRRLNLALDAA